jgi:hypothetical protein
MKIFYTAAYKRGALLHGDIIYCGSGKKLSSAEYIPLYARQDCGVNARLPHIQGLRTHSASLRFPQLSCT